MTFLLLWILVGFVVAVLFGHAATIGEETDAGKAEVRHPGFAKARVRYTTLTPKDDFVPPPRGRVNVRRERATRS